MSTLVSSLSFTAYDTDVNDGLYTHLQYEDGPGNWVNDVNGHLGYVLGPYTAYISLRYLNPSRSYRLAITADSDGLQPVLYATAPLSLSISSVPAATITYNHQEALLIDGSIVLLLNWDQYASEGKLAFLMGKNGASYEVISQLGYGYDGTLNTNGILYANDLAALLGNDPPYSAFRISLCSDNNGSVVAASSADFAIETAISSGVDQSGLPVANPSLSQSSVQRISAGDNATTATTSGSTLLLDYTFITGDLQDSDVVAWLLDTSYAAANATQTVQEASVTSASNPALYAGAVGMLENEARYISIVGAGAGSYLVKRKYVPYITYSSYSVSGSNAVVSWSSVNATGYSVALYMRSGSSPSYSYSYVADLGSVGDGSGSVALSSLFTGKNYVIALVKTLAQAAPNKAASSAFQVSQATGTVPTPTITTGTIGGTNAPTAIQNFGLASLGDKIYLGGGASSDIRIYDTSTSAWTVNSGPFSFYGAPAAAANDAVVFSGGYAVNGGDDFDVRNSLRIYKPSTGTWTSKTVAAELRYCFSCAVGDIVYVAGGQTSNALYSYNTLTDVVTTLPSMTGGYIQATGSSSMAAGGGKLYLIDAGGVTNQVRSYDIASQQWSTLTAPNSRSNANVLYVNGKLYAIGGNTNSGYQAIIDIYDPASGSWSSVNAGINHTYGFASAVIGTKIILAGGYTFYGANEGKKVTLYDTVNEIKVSLTEMANNVYNLKAVTVGNTLYAVGGTATAVFNKYTYATVSSRRLKSRLYGVAPSAPQITSYASIGDLLVTGSEAFVVTASGGMKVGNNFAVNSAGDQLTINGVPYVFPSAQGLAGQSFKNDGDGNLSWDYPVAIGGNVNQATAGSVLFVGSDNSLAEDNANFFYDQANSRLGLATSTPERTLDVNSSAIFRGAIRQEDGVATKANWEKFQAEVSTTDGVDTALATVATVADSTTYIKATVLASCMGGVAGIAGDSGVWTRTVEVKNVGGTVTANVIQSDYTSKDQRAWKVTFDVSGAAARIMVTGAVGSDIDWTGNYEVIVLGGASAGNPSITSLIYGPSMSGAGFVDLGFMPTNIPTGKYFYLAAASEDPTVYAPIYVNVAPNGYGTVALNQIHPTFTYLLIASDMDWAAQGSIIAFSNTIQIPEGTAGGV
jgi:hypothetical protein